MTPRRALALVTLLLATALPAAAGSAGMASTPAGACDALAAQFDALVQGPPAACRQDADCGCHPDLRLDGRLLVADRARAATLTKLSNRYRAQHCPTGFVSSDDPLRCSARCVEQRCR